MNRAAAHAALSTPVRRSAVTSPSEPGAPRHLVLRDERAGQVGVGEGRHDRVDPRVQRRGLERDGARRSWRRRSRRTGSVPTRSTSGRAAGASTIATRVPPLVRGVVQVHQPARGAEPAGGVDEHRVAVAGQRAGGRQAVGLGAAEPVGQDDRRRGPRRVGGQQGRVEA